MAKTAKALEWDLASKIGFGCLVLTWIVARLYLYPFVYVRSAFLESAPLLEGGMTAATLSGFHALLSVLIILNLMWFHMMLRLIWKLVKGGKAEDPTLVKKAEATKAPWVVPAPSNDSDCDVSVDSTAFSDADSSDSLSDDEAASDEQ